MYRSLLRAFDLQLAIFASGKGVVRLSVGDKVENQLPPNAHTEEAVSQLVEYFQGERTEFDLRIDVQQGTDFQRQVWKELHTIPYGSIVSYRELATAIGNAKAVRAVGRANGMNPIPIIVPCHRVIGSDGLLTGYALGLELKQRLLNLENPVRFPIQTSLF